MVIALSDRNDTMRTEEITFQNGDTVLAGTLSQPATAGPHPAIVFIHGDGAMSRDSGGYFGSLRIPVMRKECESNALARDGRRRVQKAEPSRQPRHLMCFRSLDASPGHTSLKLRFSTPFHGKYQRTAIFRCYGRSLPGRVSPVWPGTNRELVNPAATGSIKTCATGRSRRWPP